jgi:hypothetical protein
VYQSIPPTPAPAWTEEITGNRGLVRTDPTNEFWSSDIFTAGSMPVATTIYFSMVITNAAAGGYIVLHPRVGGDGSAVQLEFWIHSNFLIVGNSGNVGHGLTFADGDTVHVLFRSTGPSHSATLWRNNNLQPSTPTATGTGGAGVGGQILLQTKRGPGQNSFYLDNFVVFDSPTVAWPPPPVLDLSDNFNRADTAPTQQLVGQLGPLWEPYSPHTWSFGGIKNNMLTAEYGSAHQVAYIRNDLAINDMCYAQIDFLTGGGEIYGPVLCHDHIPGTRSGYDILVQPWNNSCQFERNGAVVATYPTSVVTTPIGAWVTLRLEKRGAVITTLVNGLEVGSYTDPSPLTGNGLGFSFGTANEQRMDNWSGGRLPVFTDDFTGTGPLNSVHWNTGGFSVPARVNGNFTVNGGDFGLACLSGFPLSSNAQYAEVTKKSAHNVSLTLSSDTSVWTYPRPTGYTVLSRSDGVAECFVFGGSLGYSFIPAAPIGCRVRAEHDGAGNIKLLHDGVVMKEWDDPGTTLTGPYVWLNVNDGGLLDDFEAGPLGGVAPPTPNSGSAAVSWSSTVAAVGENNESAGGLPITETWTGTTGTPWPTPKWSIIKAWPQYVVVDTIQANRGRLSVGGTPYAFGLAELADSTHTDVDITFTYALGNATAESYAEVFYRMDHTGTIGDPASSGWPVDCYAIDIEPHLNTVYLANLDTTGIGSNIATVTSAGVNVTSDIKFRILAVGTNHKVKWWPASGAEPSTWQIDINDSTWTSGHFALGLYNGDNTGTNVAEFDNLSLVVPTTLLKGVGAIPDAYTATDLATLNCSWWYEWDNPTTHAHVSPPGFQYVPMMWGDWDRTYPGFEIGGTPAEAIGSSTILLGFNEPNIPSQADMTVARCLELWPQLEATGARLGSPALSPNGGQEAYLDAFFAGNPRVDFLCLHWYPEYDAGYPNIGNYLDHYHTKYGLPIWLTEITAGTTGSIADSAALITTVMAACEARPFVERIAWFFLARDPAAAGWPNSSLVNANGTLNAAGTAYASYPPGTITLPSGPNTGTAAVGWSSTTTAAGKKVQKGTATTTWTDTVAANGKRTAKATAAVAWTDTLTAAGKRAPKATAATSWVDTLAAAGKRVAQGAVAATWSVVTAATGKRAPKGTITTSHTWVTAAQGVMPIVGAKQGSASVSWISALTSVGKRTPKATTATTWSSAIAAAGSKPSQGTAAVSWVTTLLSAGKRAPKGATAVTTTDTLTATGKRSPAAVAALATNWVLAANGLAPTVGVKQGFATVTYSSAVTAAVGKRVAKAGTATTYSFVIAAAGKKIQQAIAAVTWTSTITAVVGKRFPKATVAVVYSSTVAAVGKRAPKATTAVTYAWATTANGVKPVIGFKQGFATVTYASTVTAAGKRSPKATAVITHAWPVAATGQKLQKGTTSTSYQWAATAAGKKLSQALVAVAYTVTTQAAGTRTPKARADVSYRSTVVAMGVSGIAGVVEGWWNGQEIVAMQYGSKPVIDWALVPA